MSLKDIIEHPVTALASILGSITLVDPSLILGVFSALWSSVGSLFTFLSISTFTVPRIFPEFGFIAPYLKGLFAVVLVLYLAKMAYSTYQTFEREI
jgi:hypothetical protein